MIDTKTGNINLNNGIVISPFMSLGSMKNLNFNPFPILRTERLLLRQLEVKDAPLYFNYQSSKQNFLHVDMPVYTDISQALTFIKEKKDGVQQNKWILWAITDIK